MRSQALDIYQGDDYTALVNVTHQGSPTDLSGYTATSQIRRQVADNDPTIDATFACAIVGSAIRISLAKTVTVTLSGCYVWDLQLTETATGLVMTIAHGPCHVTQEVTR